MQFEVGQIVEGKITGITNFGVFVDLGVKVNGLIHISQLADHFVSDPSTIVSLHQQVMVKVLDVDLGRNRIQLALEE